MPSSRKAAVASIAAPTDIIDPRRPEAISARIPAVFVQKNRRFRFPSAFNFGGTETIQPPTVSPGTNSALFAIAVISSQLLHPVATIATSRIF